jgi:uncharacterized protein YjbJ (UPF0337 family)
MNWDYIEANWTRLNPALRERWAMLTDENLQRVAGNRDRLVGLLQGKYFFSKEQAEIQVSSWMAALEERAQRARTTKPRAKGPAEHQP